MSASFNDHQRSGNNDVEVFSLSLVSFVPYLLFMQYSLNLFIFQNGNVSSGEESVMNGVITDNDETSKDSEGKVMLCIWIIVSRNL